MLRSREFVVFAALSTCLMAEDPIWVPEYQLKAQVLSMLPGVVMWPEDKESGAKDRSFVIGVLGNSPFQGFLDENCRGRDFKGRPLEVKYSRHAEDLLDCPVVFLCASEERRFSEIFTIFRDKPTLIVSDTSAIYTKGTMVNLRLDSKQVRMEVNLPILQGRGLRISSHVLRFAKVIR